MVSGRRWRALSGLSAALVMLTGCSIEGRVQAFSASNLSIDLTVHGSRSPYCSADIPGLSVTPGNEPGGVVSSCHYAGKVDLTTVGSVLGLASAGEYLVLVINPFQFTFDGPQDVRRTDVEAIDITVVMPGTVVEHNGGRVSGAEVRITELEQLQVPGGLRLVALNHAGPPWWQWWAGGGFVVGLLLGLAAIGVARLNRRRRSEAGNESSEPNPTDDQPDPLEGAPINGRTPGDSNDEPGWAPPDPVAPATPDHRGRSDPARWAPEN